MSTDPYRYFRIEARELVEQLGQGLLELEHPGSPERVGKLLRLAHTLKGAARVVKQRDIADLSHTLEDHLAAYRDRAATAVERAEIEALLAVVDRMSKHVQELAAAPSPSPAPSRSPSPSPAPSRSPSPSPAPSRSPSPSPSLAPSLAPSSTPSPRAAPDPILTVRAELADMDALLDSISEAHSQLGALRRDESAAARARHLADLALDQLGSAGAGDPRQLRATLEELRGLTLGLDRSLPTKADRLARELEQVRATAERLRLVPAAILFPVLERTAWDVARAQGKQVAFDSRAPGIRLDAHIVAAVQGALVQLVRNAVAHGIEPAAERVRAGKPAEGLVSVVVTRDGRRVSFACHDDGRGIDEGAVRRAARDRGQDVAGIDRAGLVDLLFQGGISTAGQLTEVSGRGVGLDVVREVAERLGGTAAARPRPGGGTTFELVVPLAMAAIEGLQVEAGGAVATIPLDAVRRTLRLAGDRIVRADGGEAVVDGSDVIPFLPLAPLLGGAAPHRAQSWSAVIVQTAGGDAAVGVDRLVGTGTVVVRPLPPLATAVAAVAGASLDGEGNPRLVLDPGGLVAAARRRATAAGTDAPPARLPVLVIDDSLTTRMLEQSILDSAGYDVDTAASAEEGLVKAAARRYALFLVDVEMPGIDGFTFIERTQADPTLRDVPAILVTSRNAPEDLRRGQEVGARGYVVKSEFDQVALLDHIRRLVG